MKPLNQTLSRLLDTMTEGLADPCGEGESARVYDNAPGAYMAAHVERIGPNRYSVAHYFTQNGDRIADPDMEFVKADGAWYPAACQFATGSYSRAITECDENGRPSRYSPRTYRDLKSFAGLLLKNVKSQQGIKVPRKPSGPKGGTPKKAEIPFEGEDLGTLKIGRSEYRIEKRDPTEAEKKVNGDRPVYALRGKRGAVYVTMRNRRNPNHMFLINGRSFGVALDGTWLTDEGGQLRVAC